MPSMRRLRRRLLRWRRYAARTCWNPRITRPAWCGPDTAITPGHTRAWARWLLADEDRRCRAYNPFPDGQCVCGGCVSVGPCEYEPTDDYRCCLAGDDGHPGPCATTCSDCGGAGRCPYCGGVDDLGCGECGGSGSCPGCWGAGEHVEEYYIGRPIETISTGGLL
jgi:hypothetical protein